MSDKDLHLNRPEFLRRYCFSEEEFARSGLDWAMLESICARHAANLNELQATADYVSQRLRQLSEVHSLKVRVKHPEHLVAKIIRKKLEKPDLAISGDTYSECITDLIGIRALHLFKDQWQPINDFVTSTWELCETPIAYVREGDSQSLITAFQNSDCNVQEHPFGYRSVHYLIKSRPAKQIHITELQVRTLFEEGWSEIDHQIRYPRLNDNPHLAQFLTIFNRLAGSADEMGSFIKTLSLYLADQGERLAGIEEQLKSKEEELKKTIGQLKISIKEKQDLEAKVAELRKSSQFQVINPLLGWSSPGIMNLHSAGSFSVPFSTIFSANPNKWSTDIVISGLAKRVCTKCGKEFEDDSLFTVNDRCLKCRGSAA